MKKYILAGAILFGIVSLSLITSSMIYENQNTKEFNDLVDAVTERVMNDIGSNGQQLTYPLDPNSVVAVEKASDTFLYTKIFDLVWKKLFHYYTDFESLDGFLVTGTAGHTGDGGTIYLATTAVSGNTTKLQRASGYNGLITFSQPSNFRTTFYSDPWSSETVYVTIGFRDSATVGNYYGFKIHNGSIYGISSNAGTNNETSILLSTIADDNYIGLEARFIPSDSVQFLLNSVEKGRLTSGLPKPTGSANNKFYEITLTTNTTAERSLVLSHFEYLQRRNILK